MNLVRKQRKLLWLMVLLSSIVILSSCASTTQESAPPPPAEQSYEDESAPPPPTEQSYEVVTATVFAVGEALSVLIDDGDTEILIDGGNDGGKRKDGGTVAEYLSSQIDDGILEYVIATHSHADHIGGLDENIYDIFEVLHTIYGDKGTSKQYEQFWNAATDEENSEVHEDIDEVITLSNGVTLSVFDILDGDKNTNNNSVISLFDYHGERMLITGDAEDEKSKAVHEALVGRLTKESVSNIEVYIVGHHGSETSSSSELLSLIKPKYAIISSVGPNHGSYNNPDVSVLNRLEDIKAKIFATYVSGDILITFDNNGVSLSAPDSELVTSENFKKAA